MARTVPSGLATRIAGGSTELCMAVQITRKNGAVERYCESETAKTVNGVEYAPHESMIVGSITYGLDGFSSSLDVQFGSSDATAPSADDIRDGAYDAAAVLVTEFNRAHPEDDGVEVFWGTVFDATRSREGETKLELKGILSQGAEIVVQRYSPMCIWDFCSPDCGLNPADYTYTATVTGLPDDYTIGISGAASGQADDFFIDGVYWITSGLRTDIGGIEIRGSDAGSIKPFLANPRGLLPGDTLNVMRGCRKRRVDCKAYGNYPRFGGQPDAGTMAEAAAVTFKDWGS